PPIGSTGHSARVVVVDDASPPTTAPAIAADVAAHPGAILVRRTVNGGPGAARQSGLAAARTPLVAFVDAGVAPEPGWLAPLLAHFADPEVVAVAPRVRSRPGTGTLLDRYERRRSPLDLGDAEARVAPRARVAYVPTAALLARRAAVEAVGGFDPALRTGEDVDLVWRLVEAGAVLRYEPAVTAWHGPRQDWAAWARQRFGYGRAAGPLDRRHPGQLPPLSVSGWSVLAWGLAAAGRPGLAAGVAGGTTALLGRKLSPVLAEPWPEALRLGGLGHLHAGRWVASALTRAWWPLALVAALSSRRARRAVVAAAVVPPLLEWRPGDGMAPAAYVAARLADDVAYGAGVWRGCWAARRLGPLVPDLRSWPGRSLGPWSWHGGLRRRRASSAPARAGNR
ncbi:MAG: mycofactocin system glycosyltransferase, partial [Acidimicrobiia bacterium]|nr:mycofactocin system glycosyltransferase [Acidimicrobiia bacterium]